MHKKIRNYKTNHRANEIVVGYMHQFTTVFWNDFQIRSLISKSGVDGCGL